VLVDLALRELGERFVGLLFLAERCLQKLHRLVQAELRRPGLQGPVAGDLVMLDRLCRSKKAGIERRRALEFLHDLLALFDNAHDGVAGLAAGRLVDLLENLLKPRHVLFGLGLVLLEGGFKVLGLGGLGHMGVKFAASFGAEVTVLSTSPSKEEDAKKLGAHNFVVTKDEEQVKKVANYFDFILDTVSAPHDYSLYLGLLKTNGVMVCVGLPTVPAEVPAFNLVFQRRSLAGSLIGGLPETQEMLDYCAANNITAEVEVINIKDINKAFERMEKSDVKYRFVIDLATL